MGTRPEAAAWRVLGDDDLLGEILLRLGFPTYLVGAALVCRRWLRRSSDPSFLRRFRALHPPRLLGLYVEAGGLPRPEFVSMPHPPELATVVRRASSGFDAFDDSTSSLWDCRNGRLLVGLSGRAAFTRAVLSPLLRRPERDMAGLPPPPPAALDVVFTKFVYIFLPEDGGDGTSYYHVDLAYSGRRVSAQVTVLQSGAWTDLASAGAELPTSPERIPCLTLLAGGKLYMVTVAGYILGLDFSAATLFVVELPDGVDYEYYGNLVLSRGDDSDSGDLYLFQVKGFHLHVWHRRTTDVHDGGAGEWVLVDTISVRDTCGHLVEQSLEAAAGAQTDIAGVGDKAEFVFLEIFPSGAVVYMHLGRRRAEMVYQRDPENFEIIQVHPFMMVWPPVFPALDR